LLSRRRRAIRHLSTNRNRRCASAQRSHKAHGDDGAVTRATTASPLAGRCAAVWSPSPLGARSRVGACPPRTKTPPTRGFSNGPWRTRTSNLGIKSPRGRDEASGGKRRQPANERFLGCNKLSRSAPCGGKPVHAFVHAASTYATALVNAGCSLQSLMELLGHVSAAMSLRYRNLFNSTVRADYERAVQQAKAHIGQPLGERVSLPIAEIASRSEWREAPLIKVRLAGGLLRAHCRRRCLPVRQRLRALPELPHRRGVRARALSPAPGRRAARRGRRAAWLGRGGRPPPTPDRPARAATHTCACASGSTTATAIYVDPRRFGTGHLL